MEKVSFHSNPKERQCHYYTTALISHTSKVKLKILQTRLQQYVNHELPDVQAGFRKGRGTGDQIANIRWIIKKAREFQKNIYFCFIDDAKAFDCVDDNKLWKILKEMGIQDHLTCLLRNLYAGQEAWVRTGHGTTDWFQKGKEYIKAVYCHPAYLTYMQSPSWEMLGWMKHKLESRLLGEISITQICRWYHPYGRKQRRTKEPLDESERGEWKSWLKTQHSETKIMASGPITSWQIDGETMKDFIFGGSKITAHSDCSHEIKRLLLFGRKAMTNLDSILKSRNITLPTNVHLVKAMVFLVVMHGCESWTIKKSEWRRIDAFEQWRWRVPWTARRSSQ